MCTCPSESFALLCIRSTITQPFTYGQETGNLVTCESPINRFIATRISAGGNDWDGTVMLDENKDQLRPWMVYHCGL